MVKKFEGKKHKDSSNLYRKKLKARKKDLKSSKLKKEIKKFKSEHQIKDNPYYVSKKDQIESLAMDAVGSAKLCCCECQEDITKFPKVIIPTKQKEETITETSSSKTITIEKSNPIPINRQKEE